MPIPNSNTRRNAVNLTGHKFGRWTVISFFDKVEYKYAHGRGSTCLRWLCRCECGEEKIVRGNSLKNGSSVSCRCYQREFQYKRKLRHGHTGRAIGVDHSTPEYQAWAHMIQRCLNSSCPEYRNYGARGITVCERWMEAKNFLADMGPRPSAKYSLDRINNDGNYEPDNCRWATQHQQQRNRRTNRWIEWNGRTQVLADWARELGFPKNVITSRMSLGWTVERTFTTPYARRRLVTTAT